MIRWRRVYEGPLEALPTFRVWPRFPRRAGEPEALTLGRGATEEDAAAWYVAHGRGAVERVERLPLGAGVRYPGPGVRPVDLDELAAAKDDPRGIGDGLGS